MPVCVVSVSVFVVGGILHVCNRQLVEEGS